MSNQCVEYWTKVIGIINNSLYCLLCARYIFYNLRYFPLFLTYSELRTILFFIHYFCSPIVGNPDISFIGRYNRRLPLWEKKFTSSVWKAESSISLGYNCRQVPFSKSSTILRSWTVSKSPTHDVMKALGHLKTIVFCLNTSFTCAYNLDLLLWHLST